MEKAVVEAIIREKFVALAPVLSTMKMHPLAPMKNAPTPFS
jgi:hypothetical protein